MAVNYQQIYRDIHDFVVLATDLDPKSVRPSYVNASAEPTQDRGLLCSINLINITKIGQDGKISQDMTLPAIDMDETIYGDRNVTASIKCYGDDAQDTAENIQLFLSSSGGTEFLNGKDLGYLRSGQALDISSLQNGSFENRRQLDIEFHIVTSNTEDVNSINSSDITWSFYGSGEESATGTIEVKQ